MAGVMARVALRAACVVGAALVAGIGCDRAPASPSPVPPPAATFTVAPVDVSTIRSITRIVHRPNRVYPYLQITTTAAGGTVHAPADAVVTSVSAGPSARVEFVTSSGLRFYLTDLASTDVTAGMAVTAGQPVGRVGMMDGLLPSVGFGAISPTRPQPFMTPARYPDDMLYADSPIRYYDEPLRGSLMAAVQPPGLGEGRLSFDLPGALQGFWYLASVPLADSMRDEYRDARLWFYFNDLNPAERLSTYSGQGLVLTGDRIPDDDPLASQVTPATGVVAFHFSQRVGEFPAFENRPFVLLVEMQSVTSLRAEAFDATVVPAPVFTPAARVYVR